LYAGDAGFADAGGVPTAGVGAAASVAVAPVGVCPVTWPLGASPVAEVPVAALGRTGDAAACRTKPRPPGAAWRHPVSARDWFAGSGAEAAGGVACAKAHVAATETAQVK
jgi:hypothetical protein